MLIKDELVDYITTIFPFNSEELAKSYKNKLQKIIYKGPYIDIKPVFETSFTMEELINQHQLSPLFQELEAKKKPILDDAHKINLPLTRPLYSHQVDAIIKTNEKRNLVVTTGTGSGKTECFLIPVINALLNEKEQKGFIANQVKVILIYPMNALANDQMKRLRNILMYYPDITFGTFTGETEHKKYAAGAKYQSLHETEEAVELQKGLKNEIKSREEMLVKPPHILITNYSMLEHMLLEPNNDVLFSNADIKYIVLDEAHIYQGARGMETSLLIRRLRARIHSDSTQFILTSATLGEQNKSEKDICEFAFNLTGADFDKDSIIFGKRKKHLIEGKNIDIDPSFFVAASDVVDDEKSFQFLCSMSGVEYNSAVSLRENIFDICFNSSLFTRLRKNYLEKKTLIESIKDIPEMLGVKTIEEAIAFIFVSSFGEKNGAMLLDSRYHFFLRALEGCFISFPYQGHGQLYLERKKTDDKGNCVFELSICKKCGDMALYGDIEDDHLIQKSDFFDEKNHGMFFHFETSLAKENIEEQDKDEIEAEEEITPDEEFKDKKGNYKIKAYYLCPHCGKISLRTDGKPHCDCGVEPMVVYTTGEKYHGCLVCKGGKYNKFYVGNDAATGVIGTSLFEELPSKEIKIHKGGMDHFIDGGKQFLAFSDSRSEAAYFASYMDKTYEIFLRRRAITNVMKTHEAELISNPWNLDRLSAEVKKLFVGRKTFKENVVDEGVHMSYDSDKNTWYGIITELISQRKRNSLTALGILSFEYAELDKLVLGFTNNPKFIDKVDKKLLRPLLNELVMTVAYWGAVEPVNCGYSFGESDREFVFYTKKQKFITKNKEYDDKDEEAYASRNVSSWMPRANKNDPGKFVKNGRYDIASLLLHSDDQTLIADFLDTLFRFLNSPLIDVKARFTHNPVDGANKIYLPASAFVVKSPNDPKKKWYRCKKCGNISDYSIEGKCSIEECGGEVEEIDPNTIYQNNHYKNLYTSDDFFKLFIKEHTAQVPKEEAAKYQSDFEKNKINALSCSTTFEMGVDLGSLDTVFMRNVPPSPTNYAQRSGRAGRSKTSSAFTITYAKLSSHDFNYFDKPLGMIDGKIMPPKFKINNEKVLLRHIFAVALAYCFKKNHELMKTSVLLSDSGVDKVRALMDAKDPELTELLSKSFANVNAEGILPEKYTWLDAFYGDNGVLRMAANEYIQTLNDYQQKIDALAQAEADADPADKPKYNKTRGWYMIQRNDYENQKIIDALSRSNVLPKYGFPVDHVELDVQNKKISLSRDLSLAISEYAPGATVVANNRKYVSRYIKQKIAGRDRERIFTTCYIAECPNCNTYSYSRVGPNEFGAEKTCPGCGLSISNDKWEKAIIPYEGFVHDKSKEGDVSIVDKPERLYASEEHYVGDNKAIKFTKYKLNGMTIILQHTENDEIMVVSNSLFYVCPRCGYTYGVLDNIKDDHDKVDKTVKLQIVNKEPNIFVKSTHKMSNEHPCSSHVFERYYLSHVYKTDVVQIEFENNLTAMNNNCHDQMYSVLTAILNAISEELQIERDDISGCVKLRDNHFELVIYDAVPGGAGHVKRLLDDSGDTTYLILSSAYNKMINCKNCDSSCYNCLRSYSNQRYHDILDKHYIIDFIKPYLAGTHEFVSEESYDNLKSFIDDSLSPKAIENDSSMVALSDQWLNDANSYGLDPVEIKFYEDLKAVANKHSLVPPMYENVHAMIKGKKFTITALWKSEKVVLIESEKLYDLIKDDHKYKVFLVKTCNLDLLINEIKE